ncbi:MAG: hypothetical protein DLM62_13120 [Pseudonocardiales bacterium]|nr:MAG: hypothetical protein DLM62_13120 [Pseudonocardiales bacterium]
MTPSAGGDVDRAVPHFAPGMLAELDDRCAAISSHAVRDGTPSAFGGRQPDDARTTMLPDRV